MPKNPKQIYDELMEKISRIVKEADKELEEYHREK